jgi:hypothetical protein
LGDSARLDLAWHRCERAADEGFDAASMNLLSSTEPDQLTLVLMPGTALIDSCWPIVAIHAAHHGPPRGAESGFEAVRVALDNGVAEAALVVRQGWRATVHRLDPASARWTTRVLAGATLDLALADAGEAFDFAAWLGTALQEKWLKAALRSGDQTASPPQGEPG